MPIKKQDNNNEEKYVKAVIDQLLPKLEAMEKRIKEETRTDIQQIRSEVESKSSIKPPVDLKSLYDQAMNDPQFKGLVDSMGGMQGSVSGQPMQGVPMNNGLQQLASLIQVLKMLEGNQQANPFGNELILRNYYAQQHAQNVLYNQVIKSYMKKLGVDDVTITNFEDTQNFLTGDIDKVASSAKQAVNNSEKS